MTSSFDPFPISSILNQVIPILNSNCHLFEWHIVISICTLRGFVGESPCIDISGTFREKITK